jgi:ketosteroid isomerase-like protein
MMQRGRYHVALRCFLPFAGRRNDGVALRSRLDPDIEWEFIDDQGTWRPKLQEIDRQEAVILRMTDTKTTGRNPNKE